MSKQYWLVNKETLIINQTAINARVVAGQCQIPRTALLTKPLEPKDGFQVCAVLDENGCAIDSVYVEDHRDKTIYNTQDCKQSKTVEKLGAVEDGWTLEKPITQFDEWIDGAWVTNKQSQYEAQVKQVDAIRRSLYLNADALRNEAAMIRAIEEDEAKAADYDEQAKALYLKIREENPWPEPPIE
ncbi:hypothetical protein [Methylophaga sp.]|uniref:hypothetical protein n=1 Tax=Methylophaga sp. TaxID=2024840 RepID=UPI003A8CF557